MNDRPRQTAIRLGPEIDRQIAELRQTLQLTATAVIRLAVAKLYRAETADERGDR